MLDGRLMCSQPKQQIEELRVLALGIPGRKMPIAGIGHRAGHDPS